MMRYIIVFLIVIYTPNHKTNQIKIYDLQEEKPYEIVETLGDGYDQETPNKIEYEEVVKIMQDALYCDYCSN